MSAPEPSRVYWVSLMAESAWTVDVERDWWVSISARPLETTSCDRLRVLDLPYFTVAAGEAALPELERALVALGYVKSSRWERKESGWVAWVELADDEWSQLLNAEATADAEGES